jgi:hypothetical protein
MMRNRGNKAAYVRQFSLLLFYLFILWPAASLFAQQQSSEEGSVRFSAVDIFVDSNSAPLAAWQLEFAATNGTVKIVGIEGGDHEAFRHPPFYDPKAMQHERVILAAFSTDSADKLPTGKTRVATIHLQILGSQQPAFELKLHTAADSNGNKIPVTATFEERKAK